MINERPPINGIGPENGVRHMCYRVKGKVIRVIGYEELEGNVPKKRLADIFYTTIKEVAKRKVEELLNSGKAKVVHYIPAENPHYIRKRDKEGFWGLVEINADKWFIK